MKLRIYLSPEATRDRLFKGNTTGFTGTLSVHDPYCLWTWDMWWIQGLAGCLAG